ncbi:MAG: hypothetical protein ABI162_06115 [Luteolibacter sp.]
MKNPPLGLKSVKAIALAVTDEARAKEFYGKKLSDFHPPWKMAWTTGSY